MIYFLKDSTALDQPKKVSHIFTRDACKFKKLCKNCASKITGLYSCRLGNHVYLIGSWILVTQLQQLLIRLNMFAWEEQGEQSGHHLLWNWYLQAGLALVTNKGWGSLSKQGVPGWFWCKDALCLFTLGFRDASRWSAFSLATSRSYKYSAL